MNPPLKSFLRQFLPKAIRARRIWAGPLRGQQLVTSWHDYPAALLGRTERPLLGWFAQNVCLGQTWLDVGAHYGYTALALSQLVGPSGRIFSFEPLLSTAGYVSHTRQLNHLPQLQVVPLALGAASDQLELQQLPTVRGMVDRTLIPSGQETNTWRETILVARLDWLWPRICNGREQIDGIKIDVQGMEIEVLRGMQEILKQQQPKLIVELHPGVDRTDFLEVIEGAGYSRCATSIEPISGETEAQYLDDHSYAFQPM